MKKLIIILTIVMIFYQTIPVRAEDNGDKILEDNSKIQQLYDYIKGIKTEQEIINDMDIKSYVDSFIKNGQGNLSYNKLNRAFLDFILKEILNCFKLMVMVIVIALMCALLKNLQNAFNNESLSNIAYFACYALLIVVLSKSFLIGVNLARDTITKLTDFMAALIPVLMMLLASIGGLAEAATMDPIILTAVNLTPRIYIDFIIPIILMGFVLQFADNISDQHNIQRLTKLLNQIVLWCQGIIITIFIGIVTVRGINSSTIDAVTAKTAKFAVDNFIPIVGKALSDAVSTAAGYSIIIKNALSSLGLFIIIIIVIFPIIKLFIISMLYKFSAALIEPISDSRIVSSITSAGDSLILIMSCVISISFMFFIMISIMASAGKFILGG